MGAVIDPRLKEAETEQNLTENYNRILGIVDSLSERITALEEAARVPALRSLSVDDLTFTPEFSADVYEYAATTDTASAQIKAEAENENDEIVFASETASFTDDGTVSWAEGENVVTITVVNGFLSTAYKLTVTYTAPETET